MRRRLLPAALLAIALLAPSAASARIWTLNEQPVAEEHGFQRAFHSFQLFVTHLISHWAEEGGVIVGGGK